MNENTTTFWAGPASSANDTPYGAEHPEHVTAKHVLGDSQGYVGDGQGGAYEQYDSFVEFSGLKAGDVVSYRSYATDLTQHKKYLGRGKWLYRESGSQARDKTWVED